MSDSIPMRVHAWGKTEADVERALNNTGHSRWRSTWRIIETTRLIGPVCPLNMRDGNAVAADAGRGWAYVVYPVRAE